MGPRVQGPPSSIKTPRVFWIGVYSVLYPASYSLKCGAQFLKVQTHSHILTQKIAQHRLDTMTLISIESEAARQRDLDEFVDTFANIGKK